MKTRLHLYPVLATLVLSPVVLSSCAMSPQSPEGAASVRMQLTDLQNNPTLSVLAPMAIKDAERAVDIAEQPEKNTILANHRVIVAERKVRMASAQAQTKWLEQQRPSLIKEREAVTTMARDREINALKEQLAALNAIPTERGMVVTLGDMLFDSGKSVLTPNSHHHLYQLASFLTQYPQHSVIIEGHTDNVGAFNDNTLLSQQRAEAVKLFLVRQGVDGQRMRAQGKSESEPLSSNLTEVGRSQNRRVEIIFNTAQVSLLAH